MKAKAARIRQPRHVGISAFYVANMAPRSLIARPLLATARNIASLPTLVRRSPTPVQRVIATCRIRRGYWHSCTCSIK
jgi:hypothetical protein